MQGNWWETIARWLAEQCAEKLGCWDVDGAHPCGEDCVDCWIRRAAKEVDGEMVKDPA